MLKVGIEIPDQCFSDIDLSHPEYGNPGVGGSEYLFTLLAYQLRKNNYDIIAYHYNHNFLPANLRDFVVEDSISMIKTAERDGVDLLIHQVGKTESWYHALANTLISSVAWAHVYLEYYELQILRNHENVKRVVFVGKEEYDSYIDDDIIKKSTFIYNMIPTRISACNRQLQKPVVTYVGSLVPAKGFHKLAQIWPDVIRQVPEAELYVIGNGKVYNRNAKLGKYGIAQDDYEKLFMDYLIDEEGRILPSVHFLGIVGKEKTEIFQKTKVGIVNPTALTETFCMSAVEMEYAFIPIVTKRKWGLLDTVIDGETGLLFKNRRQFIRSIVTLLKNDNLNHLMGQRANAFVVDEFSIENIIPKWLNLLENIEDGKNSEYLGIQRNWGNDWKWLKQCIRIVRFNLGMKNFFSFNDMKNELKKCLKR